MEYEFRVFPGEMTDKAAEALMVAMTEFLVSKGYQDAGITCGPINENGISSLGESEAE